MKRVAIIGGGIAGLSAGIYASQNGFETVVLEQHRLPGGLCTGWNRTGTSGRFTMEGCIHYVLGLAGGPFRQMWDELGVDRPVLPVTELFTLRHPSGAILPVCTDVDELAARMRAIAPEDSRAIARLAHDIKLFARYELPVDAPAEVPRWDKLRALGSRYPEFLVRFGWYRAITTRTYARRFRNPILRWAVARLGTYPDYPAIWTLMVLSRMHRGEAGYPMGGSLELAYDLEERLLQLGGTIRYGARVIGMRRTGRRISGIVLASGEIVEADAVIAAGDLRRSLEWLRDAGLASRRHEAALAALRPGHGVAQVSLGVRLDRATDDGRRLSRRLDADDMESLVLYPSAGAADTGTPGNGRADTGQAGPPAHRITVRQYRRDTSLAPGACRVITCQVETDFGWW
ncbi:MAG: phytoene desaturase family protein, partial [Spirochaetota bacterium]